MIVGSAHVRIIPDLTGFNRRLREALDNLSVKVRVSVDAEATAAQIQNQLARVRPRVAVRVLADTAPMTQQVREALAKLPRVRTISFEARAGTLNQQAQALEKLAPRLEAIVPLAEAAAAAFASYAASTEAAAVATRSLASALREVRLARFGGEARTGATGMRELGAETVHVGANAAAANEAIRRLLQEFRNLLVVTAAVQIVGRPFVNLIGFGLRSAASFEQARVSLDALLGSAELGQRVFADLLELAKRTPFAFGDFLGAAQQLAATGLNAKEVVTVLEAVTTAAAASGATSKDVLDRAVLALTQIRASSRLLSQDLRQIFQALPAVGRARVFDEIARAMGVTREQAEALNEEGLIPSELAFAALVKAMREVPGAAQALEAQSRSLTGVLQRLREVVQITFAEAFGPVGQQLSRALDEALPEIRTVLGKLASTLARGLGDFLPRAGALFASLVESVILVTRAFFAAAPALTGIAQAIAAIVAAARPFVALLERVPPEIVQLVGIAVVLHLVLSRLIPVLTSLAASIALVTTGISGFTERVVAAGAAMTGLKAKAAALTIALTALVFFLSRKAEASAKAKARLEELRGALSQAMSASEGFSASLAVTAANALLSENELKALAAAGVSTKDAIQALAQSSKAFDQLVESLGEVTLRGHNMTKVFSEGAWTRGDAAEALKKLRDELEKAAKAELDAMVATGQVTKAQAEAARAGTTYTGALKRLADQQAQNVSSSLDFALALSSEEQAALKAQAAMASLREAERSVSEVVDATVGRTLRAASASLDFADARDRLAAAEQALRDELQGTDEERRAVADAEEGVRRALEAQRDARERLSEAVVRQREAHQRLAEAMATEAERAAENLLRAQLRLERSHLRLIELEERRRDLQEELTRAQDPRRIAQLENLIRLRASVGAAPASFLDELDRRIDQLKREVGPEAVARIQREMRGLELDIAEGRLAVKDATLDVAEAERQRREGTDELKRAIEDARRADQELESARNGVRDATRQVQQAEEQLRDARRKLEPDAQRVVELNRQIQRAQLDVVQSAVAMALAIGTAASASGEQLKRRVVGALDEILERVPQVAQLFQRLATEAGLQIGMDLTITNIEELRKVLQDAVRGAFEQEFNIGGGRRVRQHGGPVWPGAAFLVGEAGPELFVPDRPGHIVPNRRLAALGAPVTVNVVAPSTDAREIVDRALERIRTERFLRGL